MHKFIICGASRAGKSTLSERLVKEFGVSWLVGDCLVESLENAFPKTGIHFFGGFEKKTLICSQNTLFSF
jgi:adenylate kinase family enzyme